MSVRRRPTKNQDSPAFGSLAGPAIDFLKTDDPVASPDIGIRLINNAEPGAFFVVQMYFGPITDDNIFVTKPAFKDQRYLRFKLSLISSRAGRRSFAKRINEKVEPLIKGQGVGEAMYTDSYVCGSPANSFFVVSFPCTDTSTFNLDAEAMAEAITGVKPGVDFKIDSDGHMYQYTVSGGEMRVTRQPK